MKTLTTNHHPCVNLLYYAFMLALSIWGCATTNDKNTEKPANGWEIYDNGSFDFRYGHLLLEGCYPAIDGRSIHAIEIDVTHKKHETIIRYFTGHGDVILTFQENNGQYVLRTTLRNFKTMPDRFHPLAGARITGAGRMYRQGFGFAGPSLVMPVPTPVQQLEWSADMHEDTWSYDSYLFSGLITPGNSTLVISAFDHSRFLHRSTFYNQQERFGLIDRHLDNNILYFRTGFMLENFMHNDRSLELPAVYFETGSEPYSTFQRQAQKMASANQVELTHSPRYYFCSWYEFHKEFNEALLVEMLEGIDTLEVKPQLQTIQIDDGYAWYGDWLNINKRYPSGMQSVVEKIKSHGYDAGIWIAPFMVSSNSFIFKKHKDWLLRDTNGEIIKEWDNEEEDVYVLDTSHPEALAYLRKVFRTFREMGITSFKTDFMDWGLRDSRHVTRHNPGKTSVQYFTEVLDMIKEEIGEESYWLGCIAPYQPMVGYADGMRLSNDVGANWTDATTGNMFRETFAGQFFNNILWQNDPDVLYLRDYASELTPQQKEAIALWDGMLGGTITTSCRLQTVSSDALNLWDFIEPGDTFATAKPFNWDNPGDIFMLSRPNAGKEGVFLLLLNHTENTTSEVINLQEFTSTENLFVFAYENGRSEAMGEKIRLEVPLSPRSAKLFYLSADSTFAPGKLNR